MPAATTSQAILERFTASGAASEFTASGGLWFDTIPPTKNLPFIAFEHGGEMPIEETFEGEYFETGTHDFHIFAVGVAETERLALLVKAVFDVCIKHPQLMELSNAKLEAWTRTGYRVMTAPFTDDLQRQIGQADFSYQYRVQRTLPTS